MYRVLALGLIFLAVSCGGGSAAGDETPTQPPATNTPAQAVAGARNDVTATPAPGVNADGTYTVAEGDTLWEIAARFETTVEAIVGANELADADSLTVGQVLNVRPAAEATPSATVAASQ